ncbi:MAG TPA: PspC domain-containing protein [Acidobacteriaceae bacterium]|nr:PspC domain-containing protein [Acidobacteriaceae bacterium]
MVCPACGTGVAEGARYCSGCGRPVAVPGYVPASWPRLERPQYGRMIAGVCAGLAQRYGWDVVVVRLVVVLIVLFGCGTPLIAYLIAWIVMPNGPYVMPQTTTGGMSS